jgi:hypothetical protein
LIIKQFKLIVVGSSSSVNAAADDEDAGAVDGKADGVGRPVARVPSPAVACASESAQEISRFLLHTVFYEYNVHTSRVCT